MIVSLCIAATCGSLAIPRQEGGPAKAPDPKPAAIVPQPPQAAMTIAPKSGSAILSIKSPLFPGDELEFVTCEAVLDGTRDFGIYPIQLDAKEWKVEDGRCSWTWTFPEGFHIDFSATPEDGSVLLKYTLRNESEKALGRVQLIPCLPTMGAPSFYPGTPEEARRSTSGRQARTGRDDYTQLYERLWLWSKGKKFSYASSKLGRGEKHLAFMRAGEEPIQWSWFVNSEETFDVPLLAVESKDGKRVLAIGVEKAIWTCSNCGDGRACVHLFPYLGRVEPGKSASVTARIYLMEGGPDDARKRFEKDFPKAAGG